MIALMVIMLLLCGGSLVALSISTFKKWDEMEKDTSTFAGGLFVGLLFPPIAVIVAIVTSKTNQKLLKGIGIGILLDLTIASLIGLIVIANNPI